MNKAMRINPERFPIDIIFQLDQEEAEPLKFQTGMSKVMGGVSYASLCLHSRGN